MALTAAPAAPAGSIGKTLPPDLQKAIGRITEISSLPEITTKIVQVVEDPRATARDMHDIVRTDPALAAKILKVVNSAFYGLPSQIASLDRAILMLGLSAVKNIALAASLSRMFKAEAVSEQFAARDLWKHCIAVAVCARQVANQVKSEHADETFVAGLVHDMGLIVAQQIFAAKLKQVAETCFATPQDFCTLEEQVVGADHQALGGALGAKWKFPPGLRYAIAYHHDPRALQAEFRKVTGIVHVADVVCCEGRFGFWLTAQGQVLTDELLQIAGLSRAQLAQITEDLPSQVTEAEQIFSSE
jgi:HD-like signal output (HDOD) protein